MNWSKRSQELGLPGPQGRLGGPRRRLDGLRPFGHRALGASSEMVLASDSDRRAVAVARANVETLRAQAYQACWRMQLK